MAITAKVRCNYELHLHRDEQVQYTFAADYLTDQGRAINAEWAKYTPGLNLTITVKPEVTFEVGRSYTLTFEPE
jgi:hypothetical protein